MQETKSLTLSVVIPYYSERPLSQLFECINTIHCQLLEGDEIVLVCNGPNSYASYKNAKLRLYGNLRIVQDSTCANSYDARNIGVAHSTGDIIAFIDADAYADVTWVSEIKRYFKSYPEVKVMGGCVVFSPTEHKLSYITCNLSVKRGVFKTKCFASVYSGGDFSFVDSCMQDGIECSINSRAIVHHTPEHYAERLLKTLRYGSGTTFRKLIHQFVEGLKSNLLFVVKVFGYAWYKISGRLIGRK